jgi:hypothetical protein
MKLVFTDRYPSQFGLQIFIFQGTNNKRSKRYFEPWTGSTKIECSLWIFLFGVKNIILKNFV